MRGKRVLLIVGGGIAAYKALETIRRLKERGMCARAIFTAAGAEFVTPLSIAALTGEKVYGDLFSLTDEAEMGHIELSRSADLVVVAPATADLMAKLAGGHANDLASTALLATDKRVLMAPAMNVRMWEHPATRKNLATLKERGVLFVGPNEGEMACGEFGPGRMAEPDEIADAIEAALSESASGPLSGVKALVTAGPTEEPLDPVRFIANRSSGKQGYAIAAALAEAGAETVLVSGPVAIAPQHGITLVNVQTAREMLAVCEAALPVDVAVFAAAVSDWRPATAFDGKLKRREGPAPAIEMVANPDILSAVAHGKNRPVLVIGFAAETDDVVANATAKRAKKGCDWILANDVSAKGGAMGGGENTVHLITSEGVEDWPRMRKADVARRLVSRIVQTLGNGK